jgi:uncharacterized protein YxeA
MAKKILLAVLIIILIIIIGGFFVYFQKDQDIAVNKPVNIDKANSITPADQANSPVLDRSGEKFRQKKAEDRQAILKEREKQFEIYESALAESKAEDCKKLSDTASQEVCIRQIALKNSDSRLCGQLNSASSTGRCIDEILLNKAVDSRQIELCPGINDASLLNACLQKIIDSGINSSECEKIPLQYEPHISDDFSKIEPRDICLSQTMKKESVEQGDLDNCYNIPLAASRVECIIFLSGKNPASDEDGDGLNYYEELVIGTDPNKADTDGDGYTDGQEVKDSYNPKGSGTYLDLIKRAWSGEDPYSN